ncbi:hypothetical protein GCM10020229_50260 [Kitasatospora albolonga]
MTVVRAMGRRLRGLKLVKEANKDGMLGECNCGVAPRAVVPGGTFAGSVAGWVAWKTRYVSVT